MLAPRKKLWSTPAEVVEAALQLIQPSSDDVIYDLGAGDGRFVIMCRKRVDCKCIGIEIDPERAAAAQLAILEEFGEGLESSLCEVVCGNALDWDYSDATAFYLYLVPYGLKRVLPTLQKLSESKPNLRVVTYMSPFQDIEPKCIVKVTPKAQPDAKWPLYFYVFNPTS